MMKLQQLIQDMCPNGVEFKKLGEVCELKRGSGITESQAIEGDVPVIAGGQKPAYYHNQSNREGLNITVAGSGAYAGYVAFWEQPIFVSDAFTVTPKDTSLDIKFVYYFLKNIQPQIHNTKKGSGVPHVHPSSISDFEIPLPPLEIQKKIVECLDKFSALAAELQAELQMRRKQYEYYRTQLLTPHSEGNSADKTDDCNWEWKTLGEILDYEQPTKYIVNDTNYDDSYPTPVLTAGQSFILGYTDEKTGIYKASKENPTIIFDDFTTSFHWVDFDFKVKSSAMKMLRPKKDTNVNFRFVYYAMQCIKFQATEHTRYWISKYSQFSIPLPPLETQNKIANDLDKFEKIINSLSDGIPAEQAAQQKRYEYYRDLLLTFPRKAV